jgi:shikimate 5-dehydrogenase
MKRHEPAERPAHVTAVDILESQLDHLRTVLTRLPQTIETELVLSAEPRENDKLMGSLPEGSLVINATGMGKDRPGSPITDDGVFPERGIAWDLNYRGELGFVRQAQAQAEQRKLAVHDGWRYFLYNWTEVIAQVFDVKVSPEMFVSEKRP